jgi:hypothetical protein
MRRGGADSAADSRDGTAAMSASSPKTRLAVPSVSLVESPWLRNSRSAGSYAGGHSNLYAYLFVFVVNLPVACPFHRAH